VPFDCAVVEFFAAARPSAFEHRIRLMQRAHEPQRSLTYGKMYGTKKTTVYIPKT
jgi:hypothetical protein